MPKLPRLPRLRRAGAVLAVALACGCAATRPLPTPEQAAAAAAERAATWGVRIESVRVTAVGHMVDLRYRVLDTEKALPLFDRHTKPYLLHQKSGKALEVPRTAKLGPLRASGNTVVARTYTLLFGNTGKLVQPGDRVTLAIGEFRAADLLVQ